MAHLVGFLLLGCHDLPRGDPARPDILLVSIDSLRRDHVGAFGATRGVTPTLDRLAASGLAFPEARSASPWTLPSHLTMLTGKWPTEHRVVEDDLALAPDVPMIQERLRDAGWATAGFTSTVYVSRLFGFSRGFGTWDDGDVTEQDNLRHTVHLEGQVTAVLEWARALPRGTPAFVFLHTYDAHYPYLPPDAWNERLDPKRSAREMRYRSYGWTLEHPLTPERRAMLVDQYDECIGAVDEQLGRLLHGWDRPVRVLVTADHGEEFTEHGGWGHGHTLHPEVLDIPLVVAGPGVPVGVREERVGTVDLANTIAAMAGVEGLGGDGVDLRGPVGPRAFWEETSRFDTRRLSVSEGALRYELDLTGPTGRLFDRAGDPAETVDVATDRPEEAERLRARLLTHVGEPWNLLAERLTVPKGTWSAGQFVEELVPPSRFGLWPPDGRVSLAGGPLRAAILLPDTPGVLTFDGPRNAVGVDLGTEVRDQLEALGYTQGADE